METLLRDLRHTFRQLRRSPGFTLTAVLTLAFGIGATTAIFSIVDGVLLRPLPFPEPDRLVTLGDHLNGTDWGEHESGPVTGPEVITYPRDTHSFQSLGGYGSVGFELSGIGEPAQINGARMSPSVFSTLGVAPLLGRVFSQQEDQQRALVAVLSYATWKGRFNGDPHILGSKILLDRKPYSVIGVMPRDFEFPLGRGHLNRTELWVPMSLLPEELSPTAALGWGYRLVGRLKPGVTPAQAQDDAEVVAQQIMRSFPPEGATLHINALVFPLQQITIVQARPLLRMLFLAVAVVLLIACANLAGLLLVRAIRRSRETAVRLAVGAPASTVLRQMVLESLVLGLTGGLLGIGLAALALTLGKGLLPETLPRMNEITLNWTIIGFALTLATLTGLLCGLAPGLAAMRINVNASLKEGGRSGTGSSSHARLRSVLVIAEIAIAIVLLAASGLLLRSFSNMSAVDLGFRPENVTTAVYALPQKQYATQSQIDGFNKRVLQQLRQLPGVEAAGLTNTIPTTPPNGMEGIVVEGYANPHGIEQATAVPFQVIGDFFKTLGMPLIRGRYFTESDNSDGQLVVIVNHALAEHYWPHQDPLGKRMRVGTANSNTPWMTIVGEMADVKLNSPDADAMDQFYQPVPQLEKDLGTFALPTDLNGNGGYIVMRSALPPEQMENALRATVHSIDMQLPLTQVQTMEQVVSQSEAPRRFNTILLSAFAAAAVLLAVLGIYSIIAFSVASRAQEMAIRMALGSQRAGIVSLILVAGLKLAGMGCVVGLAGAAAASSIMRSFLFHVSPFDPAVMTVTALAVLTLAVLASALPAHRAASVDPTQVLRGE